MIDNMEAGIAELEDDPGQGVNGPPWPFVAVNEETDAYGFSFCTGF